MLVSMENFTEVSLTWCHRRIFVRKDGVCQLVMGLAGQSVLRGGLGQFDVINASKWLVFNEVTGAHPAQAGMGWGQISVVGRHASVHVGGKGSHDELRVSGELVTPLIALKAATAVPFELTYGPTVGQLSEPLDKVLLMNADAQEVEEVVQLRKIACHRSTLFQPLNTNAANQRVAEATLA